MIKQSQPSSIPSLPPKRVYPASISSSPNLARLPHPPARAYPVVVQRSSHPWLFLLPMLILAAVFLPVVILVAGYTAFQSTDLILPGVRIGMVNIGGMPRSEALKRIDETWNGKLRLQVTDGKGPGPAWSASPIEMGLWIDPQSTVERAYQVGRGPGYLYDLGDLINHGTIDLAPRVVFSRNVSRDRLLALAPEMKKPAHNAYLRLENGRWTGVPAVMGSELDIDETLKRAEEHAETIIISGTFPLFTRSVSPLLPDPAPLLNQLEAALSQPLHLRAYDPITDQVIEWQVPREEFDSWVTVENESGQSEFTLDGSHLVQYLENWKTTLGPERTLEEYSVPPELTSTWLSGKPFNVLIRHLPTTYTVEPYDTLTRVAFKVGMPYWKIEQANPGMDLRSLTPGQVLTIPSKNDMLPLPVVVGKRIVINITQQRLWTYENGELRSETKISTGIASSPTYPGIYQVRSHELDAYASVWDLRMPFFMGIYEGWPGFMNGIHGLPTLSSGWRLWENALGSPASYGCIILGMAESEDLYYWAEDGVVVEIQP